MKGKALISFVVASILVSAFAITPGRATTATLAAADIVNTGLTPGSTFQFDITIDDVEAMFGFNFFIYYDTEVLTATNFGSYYPFTSATPSEINDTAGYVSLGYSYPPPEYYGLYTTDPYAIVWVQFSVDALGASQLDIRDSVISDVYGLAIAHYVDDGFFANLAFEQYANLVRKSAWPEHHHWSASKDPDQTIFGKVKSLGTAPTKAKVVFKITYEDALWFTELESPEQWIKAGHISDLTISVTKGDLEPITTFGKYYVEAQCWFDSNADGIIDTAGTKIKSFTFSLVP